MSSNVILGIDIGFATTGWAALDGGTRTPQLLAYGTIDTPAGQDYVDRLQTLFANLQELIAEYQPDLMAIESLFYFKNKTTVIKVSQARGVALLAAGLAKLPVVEYTPLQVKVSVSGYGRADKSQVQQMVQKLLKLDHIPKPDDAADAIAISICHYFSQLGRKV